MKPPWRASRLAFCAALAAPIVAGAQSPPGAPRSLAPDPTVLTPGATPPDATPPDTTGPDAIQSEPLAPPATASPDPLTSPAPATATASPPTNPSTNPPPGAAGPPGLLSPDWQPRQAAELQALDKVDARVERLVVPVGQSARFGALEITVRACLVRPPDQASDAASLLQISDPHPGAPGFSGWMLAAEPALGLLEHPIYDVRVLGCR
jgi:hypothetical protein